MIATSLNWYAMCAASQQPSTHIMRPLPSLVWLIVRWFSAPTGTEVAPLKATDSSRTASGLVWPAALASPPVAAEKLTEALSSSSCAQTAGRVVSAGLYTLPVFSKTPAGCMGACESGALWPLEIASPQQLCVFPV